MADALPGQALRDQLGVKSPQEIEHIKLLVFGESGCLAGDTVIGVNRGGKGFSLKLEDVVHRQNGGKAGGKVWRKEIPTRVRAKSVEGTINLFNLQKAIYSGEKEIYEVKTQSGKKLNATPDHRFLTEQGFKHLKELTCGDGVVVEILNQAKPKKAKAQYVFIGGLIGHPHAKGSFYGRRDLHRWYKHRLVVEASMNNLSLEEYVMKLIVGNSSDLLFLDKELHVHHKDGNHKNNELDNLEVLTAVEHLKLHGSYSHFGHLTAIDSIVSIVNKGIQQTFDLTVPIVDNFVANGMVVHNSGKTTFTGSAMDSPHTSPSFLLDIEGGSTVLNDKPNIDVRQARTMKAVQDVADVLHKHAKYYKCFTLDSLTELREIDMAEVMLQQFNKKPESTDLYVPSPREWGKSGSRVKEILRYLKDLPCHVIVTTLVTEYKDERTGITINRPMLPGQLAGQVPGFFDIVGFLKATTKQGETIRTMQFAKTERVMAKDRTKKLPPIMEEPTIPKIWDLIFDNGETPSVERTVAPELAAVVAQTTQTIK